MSFYQDRNGRWHGSNGRFVSASTVAAAGYGGGGGGGSSSRSSGTSSGCSGYSTGFGDISRSRSSGSNSSFSSSTYAASKTQSSSSDYYQDTTRRWHGSDGKFVSKAAVAAAGYGDITSRYSRSPAPSGYSSTSSRVSSGRSSPLSKVSSHYSTPSKSSGNLDFSYPRATSTPAKQKISTSAAFSTQSSSPSRSSSGYYQDHTGRWHGSDGKFVSKAAVAAAGLSDSGYHSFSLSKSLGLSSSKTSTPSKGSSTSSTPYKTSSSSAAASSSKGTSTSSSFSRDANGRWHGADGKFVSKVLVESSLGSQLKSSLPKSYTSKVPSSYTSTASETSSGRCSASSYSTPSRSSAGSSAAASYYQDAGGRWHGPDGKFVAKAAVEHILGTLPKDTSTRGTGQTSDGTNRTAKTKAQLHVATPNATDKGSYFQDANGRWHGPDGKFVSAAAVAGNTQLRPAKKPTRKSASKTTTPSTLGSSTSPYFQDATGRWHGPDGKFVSKAEVAALYGTPEADAQSEADHQSMLDRLVRDCCRQRSPSPSSASDMLYQREPDRDAASGEVDASETDDDDCGLLLSGPGWVTWNLPKLLPSESEDGAWKNKESPAFSLHGIDWVLRLEWLGFVSLSGEAGEERPQLGSGGWICREVTFTVAVAGGKAPPEVSSHIAANTDGSSGDAWMRVRCPPLARAARDERSLLVVHAAVEEPARGVAKDLHTLLGLGAGSDVKLKVGGEGLLPAHRAVLAGRCPALGRMLDAAGDADDAVLALDTLPAAAAPHLLEYLYSGLLPTARVLAADKHRLAKDLHCAAVCLEVDGLARATRSELRRAVCAGLIEAEDCFVDAVRSLSTFPMAATSEADRVRALRGDEGEWLATLVPVDFMNSDVGTDLFRKHPKQAIELISRIIMRNQQLLPGAAVAAAAYEGCLAECSPRSAMWSCFVTPAATASSALCSPPLSAACASWQLRWTAADLTVVRLSEAKRDENNADDDDVLGVTILGFADNKVLFQLVEMDSGASEASLKGCPRPSAGASLVVFVFFHVQSLPEHRELLLSDLAAMKGLDEGQDVVDVVSSLQDGAPDAGRVRVHRPVLMARAEVFRAMFTSGMTEQLRGAVRLRVASDVLQQLREFLYVDNIPSDAKLRMELQTFAEHYLLKELQEKCQTVE
ncbi:hypothetical protein ONE63_003538 [Megalurothrips usitatus]|uniref:BTB domain-containing protein n=1 Tax=Megalurothrips usitatus TaxID=439358 RepID=A0AAV7X3B4_9NEOP|nr:hypothetical protein ONE63_003538 [Megalurothrips usitatus]